MRAQRLPAMRGLAWLGEAFRVLRAAPVRLLLQHLAFLLTLTILVSIPGLGFVGLWLLFPALLIGPHALARAAASGAAPEPLLLLSGFRGAIGAQLRLGAVFLAAMVVVLAATLPADGGQFAKAALGLERLSIEDLRQPELHNAMLVGAVVQSVLLSALWYAPLLVAWNGEPVAKAVFFSAVAVLINWRAMLVLSLALTLLFSLVMMLALGAAVLLSGGKAPPANPAVFAVVWTLLPVFFAASYVAYREVFHADSTPSGDDEVRPGDSP